VPAQSQSTPSLEALRRARLRTYEPYPKQREFHKRGASHRERALLAGNRLGKTWSAGMEVAAHTTGRYPDWWEGRRFPGPTKWWVANSTNETTRDNPQRILLGEYYEQGTGTIPALDIVKVVLARGIADQVDKLLVRHRTGGVSQIQFKAFDQRRERWQGEEIHGVWFDEEPAIEIYSEGLTRTNKTNYGPGMTFLTLTPLLGMTEVVSLFYPKPTTAQRALIQMEIEEASHPDGRSHFTPAEVHDITESYQSYEREARLKGVPMLGSGRVFPVTEAAILEEPIEEPPQWWPRLIGLDFGWDHPTAAVLVAFERLDRDHTCLHLLREYQQSEQTPVIHAAAIKAWGAERIPVAWPQDAYQKDKQSGVSTADAYRKQGLNMLPEHATFEAGGYGRESGVTELLMRMQTGRLKVSRLCNLWLDQFRTYHRKDGEIVRLKDDLLDATRYALMMARYAACITPVRYSLEYGATDPGASYGPGADYRTEEDRARDLEVYRYTPPES
jgi:phage terminase large subunit-like protein